MTKPVTIYRCALFDCPRTFIWWIEYQGERKLYCSGRCQRRAWRLASASRAVAPKGVTPVACHTEPKACDDDV